MTLLQRHTAHWIDGNGKRFMKHFFLITNPLKDGELATTKKIKKFLEQEGCSCKVQVYEQVQKSGGYTDSAEIPCDTECIMVLGGDGTLIEAARDTSHLEIPLIGINLGTLGFLAEVEQSNLEHALRCLIADQYQLESRMMLQGRVIRDGICMESSCALNDIVITRSGSLQIIHFHIYVNGQFLNEYDGDGVIISTPTGSTGYSMSAGGPIVEPGARLMVITPICPHTLNTRSIILSAEDEVVVEMSAERSERREQAEVNFDGSHSMALQANDKICVTRSERTTEIVKLNQVSFLEILHKKMSVK